MWLVGWLAGWQRAEGTECAIREWWIEGAGRTDRQSQTSKMEERHRVLYDYEYEHISTSSPIPLSVPPHAPMRTRQDHPPRPIHPYRFHTIAIPPCILFHHFRRAISERATAAFAAVCITRKEWA